LIDEFLIERCRDNFGNTDLPPIRPLGAMVKAHATKLTRVGEGQCTFTLIQNQMVVFAWPKILRFDADFACHAEMNAEPVVVGEFEEHAFPTRLRGEKLFAD
jgi:hypothetical protein